MFLSPFMYRNPTRSYIEKRSTQKCLTSLFFPRIAYILFLKSNSHSFDNRLWHSVSVLIISLHSLHCQFHSAFFGQVFVKTHLPLLNKRITDHDITLIFNSFQSFFLAPLMGLFDFCGIKAVWITKEHIRF